VPLSTRCAPSLRRAFEVAVVLLVFSLASLAAAAPLPPSTAPLPGSSFQGADGNQDDSAPLTDWQALAAAGRASHSPDPNAKDSAFAGGSKENEPGLWDFAIEAGGVDPGKDNILDAWSADDPQGADAFLYLAFTREGVQGTTFATFELNHDTRLWDNNHAEIPCRTTGDLLVTYQVDGKEVSIVLQRWTTVLADPATGCARTGRLDDYTAFDANVDAQGAVNESDITTFLPGFFDGTIAFRHFGEAALNLSRLMADGFNKPCFSYGSVWMHSRSSTSDSSNLQDYVAPRPLAVRTCSASGTKFHDLNQNGHRDAGEPGLARWMIWADYDDDGVRDANEPYAITDDEGQYVINDIRPPDGTYTLREALWTKKARRRARASHVTCSYPNDGTPGGTGSAPGGMFPCGWGPIDTSTMTDARGKDFGNYEPVEPPPPPPPPASTSAPATTATATAPAAPSTTTASGPSTTTAAASTATAPAATTAASTTSTATSTASTTPASTGPAPQAAGADATRRRRPRPRSATRCPGMRPHPPAPCPPRRNARRPTSGLRERSSETHRKSHPASADVRAAPKARGGPLQNPGAGHVPAGDGHSAGQPAAHDQDLPVHATTIYGLTPTLGSLARRCVPVCRWNSAEPHGPPAEGCAAARGEGRSLEPASEARERTTGIEPATLSLGS
jgi:hypothetical protein